ncbi:MAG: protein translocase subunit SecF [Oscillospiraceae bacterium]|jgi:preprotein translocase subunit SecF|nr:protein translocase subunit SecF [Oscillospiraceae bacterium]
MRKNNSKLCLMISAAIILVALVLSFTGHGMNIGIDFSGGILFRYQMGQQFESADIEAALSGIGYTDTPQIAKSGDNQTEAQIRIRDVENPDDFRASLEEALGEKYPGIRFLAVDRVGAVAGHDLVLNALWSVLIAALLMLIYIAIRFDFFSGMAAVFGILHDIILMCSVVVIFSAFIQVNSTFIAACLTIVGYSINNTIVLFDRIRENLKKHGTESREAITAISVKESWGRMVGTTVTTLIAIVTLYVLGVPSTKEFALQIIIGILAGFYSSTQINGYVWAYFAERGRNWKIANRQASIQSSKKRAVKTVNSVKKSPNKA